MKRKNSTRNALFTSILSLLLCVSMLVGTTFAWFTDSVVSDNNVIAAGNLDIELEYYNGSDWDTVNGATALFTSNLWEPGHTEVVYLKLSNLGSLALKYQLGINVVSETEGNNVAGDTFKLSDYIYMGVVENAQPTYTSREAAISAAKSGANGIIGNGYAKSGSMTADATDLYLAVVVYMPETVGNEANYQTDTTPPSIDLGINVVATQLENESDSFGSDYDKLATYPDGAYIIAPVSVEVAATSAGGSEDEAAGVFSYTNEAGTFKVSGVTDSEGDTVNISIKPVSTNVGIQVEAGNAINSYDIDVTGQTEDSQVQVEMFIGTNLSDVKLFHEGESMDYDEYNSLTGILKFTTSSFSVYTVTYGIPGEYAPLAKVTVLGKKDIDTTGSKMGVDLGEKTLDIAYQFEPAQTVEQAQESEYRYWHADFVVKADNDVPAESLALAGYYDAWCSLNNYKWVALTSDEVIPANNEIRLVYSMGGGTISVNYEELCQFGNDGTGFLCGAVDLTGANEGTTITVELRLYETEEPSDANGNSHNVETGKYITVGSYSYTFTGDSN